MRFRRRPRGSVRRVPIRCHWRSQARVADVVDPAIAALPVTKEELTRYAQNVLNAAGTYDSTDRQLAEEILRRLGEFDSASNGTGGAGTAGGWLRRVRLVHRQPGLLSRRVSWAR